jgi:hypothetical protein
MRAFFAACLAVIIIGAGGYYSLNSVQRSSGAAYTTDAARINPSWSWRATSASPAATPCEPRKPWQWFFVDFHDPEGEPGLCSDSQ